MNVDIQDDKGNTGMMYACCLGNNLAVKVMVNIHMSGRKRFNFALTNNDGLTAIQQAIENRHATIVACLSHLQKSETRKQYRENELLIFKRKHQKSKQRPTEDPPRSPLTDPYSYGPRCSPSPGLEALAASVGGNALHSYHALSNSSSSHHSVSDQSSRNSLNARSSTKIEVPLEPVEDLVLAVRKCAADIRQICKDYKIEYARSEQLSPNSTTENSPHNTSTKASRSLAEEYSKEDLSLRKRKGNSRRKESSSHIDLAQMVNSLGDTNKTSLTEGDQTTGYKGQRHEKEINKDSDPPRPTKPIDLITPTDAINNTKHNHVFGSSATAVKSSQNSNDNLEVRSSVSIQNCAFEAAAALPISGSSKRTKFLVPKVDCIDLSFGTPPKERTFLPHGTSKKPKRRKKYIRKERNDDNREINPSCESSEYKQTGLESWASVKRAVPHIVRSARQTSSPNRLTLPPLRESMRYNSSGHQPVKLQSLDNDLWEIIEASSHSSYRLPRQ